MKKKVVLLQHYFNVVGGIETFLINWCKTFKDYYDITLVCRDIGIDNAIRISPYCNIECDVQEDIECDICIMTSVMVDEEIFRKIKYKTIYRMICSDWSEMKKIWNWQFKGYDENTKYISVSECARQGFKNEYGIDSIIIPNIVVKEECKKPLRLVSFTRLAEEKGYDEMVKLCDTFDKYNIPYMWDVFCTNPLNHKSYGNMILHEPIMNVQKIMKSYDYVVQLSKTESFCYTLYEALLQQVPVLVTPFPNAIKEIKNGINGYILPFNMNLSAKSVQAIYEKIPNPPIFEQKGVEELWKTTLQ